MVKCKRCKKFDAVEGKKLCVACREYSRIYMKDMRAKKKVLDEVKVPKLEIHKKLPNVPMVINEIPVYSFDIIKNEKVNNVNKNKVNNVNNVNKILGENNSSQGIFNFKGKNLGPEDFRYFYYLVAGKVFRGNYLACVKELIKILEKELKI